MRVKIGNSITRAKSHEARVVSVGSTGDRIGITIELADERRVWLDFESGDDVWWLDAMRNRLTEARGRCPGIPGTPCGHTLRACIEPTHVAARSRK